MVFDLLFSPLLILIAGPVTVWLSLWRIDYLQKKNLYGKQNAIERVVLWPVLLLAISLTAYTTYNTLRIWSFRPRDPMSGSIFVVDGYPMHIDCTGTGSPTIILESGWGSGWEIWSKVQPALSQATRVCSYDRSGYGYSGARPSLRDADHIVFELHSLLSQADVKGPILLMGHSLGGMFIRDYAARYSNEVAGLIFVDAVTPQWGLGKVESPPRLIEQIGMQMACATNSPALVGDCSWPRPGLNMPRWQLAVGGLCHPQICALKPESDSFEQSGYETVGRGFYGNLPILVFSRDTSHGWEPQAWRSRWSQMQQELTQLSTQSRMVVANNSSHMIQLDHSELINEEVLLFIAQVRGKTPPAGDPPRPLTH